MVSHLFREAAPVALFQYPGNTMNCACAYRLAAFGFFLDAIKRQHHVKRLVGVLLQWRQDILAAGMPGIFPTVSNTLNCRHAIGRMA